MLTLQRPATKAATKEVRWLEDMDYQITAQPDKKIHLFIDSVLYAKTETKEEAKALLWRVFKKRRRLY